MSKCGFNSFKNPCIHLIKGRCTISGSCPYKVADDIDKDKEIARLTAENARLKKEKICLNIAEDNGVFVCSECKFATLNDYRLKLNKGDKYYHYEYNIKYCPNCGAKVENQQ